MRIRTQFVRATAEKVLKHGSIYSPPVNLVTVLRAHGIEYEEADHLPDDIDALMIEDGAKLYGAVNSRKSPQRRRFALAHELGHYFLHWNGSTERPETYIESSLSARDGLHATELEADMFAAELLVPLRMLKIHAQKPVPELAKIFDVSEHLAAGRSARIRRVSLSGCDGDMAFARNSGMRVNFPSAIQAILERCCKMFGYRYRPNQV